MYSNIFGAPWGRLARVRAVITSRRWIHPVDDPRLELANRVAYRMSHRVIGNSSAVIRQLRDVDRVPARRTVHIPNFVDARSFVAPATAALQNLRTELGIPADSLVIGCVARLVPVKDHQTLLRAFSLLAARHPRARLVLVGDGPCRPQLETLVAELAIRDRVRFAGYRANHPNLNHLFDVAVLASLSEGFPNAVVEAMAAGRPVVATAVGGTPDAVRSTTGLLVPPSDPARLSAALEKALVDDEWRRVMGDGALAVASAEYHEHAVVPRLEGVYRSLTGGLDGRQTDAVVGARMEAMVQDAGAR